MWKRETDIPIAKSTRKGKEVCGDRDLGGGRDRKGHLKGQLGNQSAGPSGQSLRFKSGVWLCHSARRS